MMGEETDTAGAPIAGSEIVCRAAERNTTDLVQKVRIYLPTHFVLSDDFPLTLDIPAPYNKTPSTKGAHP